MKKKYDVTVTTKCEDNVVFKRNYNYVQVEADFIALLNEFDRVNDERRNLSLMLLSQPSSSRSDFPLWFSRYSDYLLQLKSLSEKIANYVDLNSNGIVDGLCCRCNGGDK